MTLDSKLEKARKELTDRVMGKPGVTGTAITERGGKPCLVVYVTDSSTRPPVPGSLSGFKVVVEVTGRIRRL